MNLEDWATRSFQILKQRVISSKYEVRAEEREREKMSEVGIWGPKGDPSMSSPRFGFGRP